MNSKKMLVEWLPMKYNKTTITEAHDAGQPVIVPALLQRADSPNSNGRIYPRHVLEREVGKYKTIISSGQSVGELDHPSTGDPVVNLKNAAIAIREVWWDGNDVMGNVEVLYRVSGGQTILGLMEHGITIGLSSRGVGSTIQTESGNEMVEDDYVLLAWDAVSIGSVEGAGLIKENKVNLNESFSIDKYASIDEKGNIITRNPRNSKYQSLNSILDDILRKGE